jgi:hypothetical protein
MLALTVGERTYEFDPHKVSESSRLSAVETLLTFPDGRRINLEMPQDILFIVLNGRREIPGWKKYRGFRARAWRKENNVWRIMIHPLEDPRMLIEAHFRSKDCAIFLPPHYSPPPPFRIES